jgi:hypothetical protein
VLLAVGLVAVKVAVAVAVAWKKFPASRLLSRVTPLRSAVAVLVVAVEAIQVARHPSVLLCPVPVAAVVDRGLEAPAIFLAMPVVLAVVAAVAKSVRTLAVLVGLVYPAKATMVATVSPEPFQEQVLVVAAAVKVA